MTFARTSLRPPSSQRPRWTLGTAPARPPASRALGVSLIEALMALAVMSFGMLALVGAQATMRYNSDNARQRTEALRIASDDAERMRYYVNVNTELGQLLPSWQDIATGVVTNVLLPGNTANTSFTLTRTVQPKFDLLGSDPRIDAAAMKVVQVQVQWTDRVNAGLNANNQALLDTVVSSVAPVLSARLSVAPVTTALTSQQGRSVSIPVSARDLGDGRSAFKPFNNSTANVVWVLNNSTGLVTSRCTAVVAAQNSITLTDLATTCLPVRGSLVTGKVRFDLRVSGVTAAVSENPQGFVLPLNASTPLVFNNVVPDTPVNSSLAPECFADIPADQTAALTRTESAYACLIYPDDATGWGGRLNLVAGTYPGNIGGWTIGNAAGQLRVCRYTLASSDFTRNTDHPRTYCRVSDSACTSRVTQNLINQNYLVIRAENSCPTDVPIDIATANLVNSNTWLHQP